METGAPSQNATDKRFFWLALYAQPAWWVVLAIVSVVRLLNPIWLSLIGEWILRSVILWGKVGDERFWEKGQACLGSIVFVWDGKDFSEENIFASRRSLLTSTTVIALILTITNTLAFSRCDKFSQASSLASSAMYSGGMARNLAGGLFSRLFRG